MYNTSFFRDKSILVTGGVGSIGSVLVKKLLELDPRVIRIFDNNETGLYDLYNELQSKKIRPLIGDIKDKERVSRALEGIDIVFHAAALKHVPLCEYNPFDAIKTNILGTQNIMDAALDHAIDKVILISTDKAANPTNVMGATKLLAERLTVSMNYYRGKRNTAFSCVRFGNVLNTRGSVIPLFKCQIAKGGPITLTDAGMTRFMMTIPKAVDLVFKATELSRGGEIFILKMPALTVKDLAEVIVEEFAPQYEYRLEDIEIKIVGKRPGEKIYEELMTSYEAEYAYENADMFIVLPENFKEIFSLSSTLPEGFRKTDRKAYSSNDLYFGFLNKVEIRELLSEM
ncbi:UDP-N-acetylglucosamine 4,6-dehydratase [Methanosarcina siciliae C2J]|uniref:UDP-N-acetylglucosamine 4,6-dehydratase n=2 Tax=Methanosarcina siciliae TaxID=38027 RepID=A0A0E3P5P4_9EURY|nr:UDP-N-acetylglucosamine 4,6-dehydratase family protein [Methanosarcina siciliae]AKB29017.1 UDP-N-acetylglucosamine 4,6-dehydratase [Methanosarcina siciliae T4/M]AKB36609.1 UDP-N-acetylglucosamine 4,6-dehydratase [Methanosarcina siciliae C2J]